MTSDLTKTDNENFLDSIKWTNEGLIPAIAQDFASGRILMMAWMNRESLSLTAQKGEAVYWSRSRDKLWHKGESSGHTQRIIEIQLDCDSDVIILKVEQRGGIACHTRRESCFYRILQDGQWKTVEHVIKNPDDIYQ